MMIMYKIRIYQYNAIYRDDGIIVFDGNLSNMTGRVERQKDVTLVEIEIMIWC